MTNKDAHVGFKVIKQDKALIRDFDVDAGTATIMGRGSLVKATTDGNVEVMTGASDDYIGVVLSIKDTNGKELNYLPISTAGVVRVATDPLAILECQFEGGGTAPTAAAIHDATDPIFTHAVSTNTGQAGVELSETLAGDGNAKQFRILGLVKDADNVWGHNAKVYVMALEHAYNSTPNAI